MATYEIVAYGVTGFTGTMVAEHLLQAYGVNKEIRWAIAGRSEAKLADVKSKLSKTSTAAKDIPVILADSAKPETLVALVKKTKVILTTVGPYVKYGEPLVKACAENGVHYVDLTGEPQFIYRMAAKYEETAKQSGAIIVHCCGFDSIPSDLGAFFVVDHIKNKLKKKPGKVSSNFYYKGSVSGGTLASAMAIFDEPWGQFFQTMKILNNPYGIVPKPLVSTLSHKDSDRVAPWYNRDIKEWTAPFVMQVINAKVVRKSSALLGYGSSFSYNECKVSGKGLKGLISSSIVSFFLTFGVAALLFPPVRWLLARIAPPGSGPTHEQMKTGYVSNVIIGEAESENPREKPTKVYGLFQTKGDPGYIRTAVMLSESAVVLALLAKKKKNGGITGGFHTPASALGMSLVERLRKNDFQISIQEAVPAVSHRKTD